MVCQPSVDPPNLTGGQSCQIPLTKRPALGPIDLVKSCPSYTSFVEEPIVRNGTKPSSKVADSNDGSRQKPTLTESSVAARVRAFMVMNSPTVPASSWR